MDNLVSTPEVTIRYLHNRGGAEKSRVLVITPSGQTYLLETKVMESNGWRKFDIEVFPTPLDPEELALTESLHSL